MHETAYNIHAQAIHYCIQFIVLYETWYTYIHSAYTKVLAEILDSEHGPINHPTSRTGRQGQGEVRSQAVVCAFALLIQDIHALHIQKTHVHVR